MRRHAITCSIVIAVAGCGAKTGLAVPIPVCELGSIPHAECTALSPAGTTTVLEEAAPRDRAVLSPLADGFLVYTYSERVVGLHVLDPHAALMSSTTLTTPVPIRGSITSGVAQSCFVLFSLHSAPFDEDAGVTGPGACAFWQEGDTSFRFVAGTYDRCLTRGVDEEGLVFSVGIGERNELLHTGLDGAIRRRTTREPGPQELGVIELADGRRTVVRVTPTIDGIVIASPDGGSTTIDTGRLRRGVVVVGRSILWIDGDGVAFAVTVDASGVPILPPSARTDLGSGLRSVRAGLAPFGGWLLTEDVDGAAALVPVSATLEVLGERVATGLSAAAGLAVTDDGLVVAGERADGALVAQHLSCAR